MNTFFAASAAMLGWLMVEKLREGKPRPSVRCRGGRRSGGDHAVAGFVGGMAPVYIGAIAGAVCCLALSLKKLGKFDDSLDVVAVHLVGGLVGSILLGFFADGAVNSAVTNDGVFLGGGGELLKDQIVASVVTLAFSFVVTMIIATVINKTMGLRVDEADEELGLDLSQHAETAYTS